MARTSRRSFFRTAGAAAVVPPAGAQGQSNYQTPRERLPVLGEWDVVVAGGGSAGCSAAMAAGRLGARTLLIEQWGFLGGTIITAGDCAVASASGVDFQGVWHELVRLLKRRLGVAEMVRSPSERYPEIQWYRTSFDPEMVKWAWDSLLDEVQVEILHYSTVGGAIVEDGEIRGVIACTRGGRVAIRARRVVDASGHAMVAHEAGAPWDRGTEDSNRLRDVLLAYRTGFVTQPMRYLPGHVVGGVARTVGNRPERYDGRELQEVDPLDAADLPRAARALRLQVWTEARRWPGEEYLLDTAEELDVGASRIIKGRKRVSDEEAWELRKDPDSIARCSGETDADPPAAELEQRARCEEIAAGDYFDIPYGCILPRRVDNLLVAGRPVSAGSLAQSPIRVQQTCMATGQAAGTAAALSIRDNKPPHRLAARVLTAQLQRDRDVEPAFEMLR